MLMLKLLVEIIKEKRKALGNDACNWSCSWWTERGFDDDDDDVIIMMMMILCGSNNGLLE